MDWYYKQVEKVTQERAAKDTQEIQSTRDSLIAEMGLEEFKTNQNLIEAMFEMMPAGVRDKFKFGRTADSKPLYGGDADIFKGFAQWARTINPAGALVPGSGANSAGAIDEEIAKIEKDMRTDRAAYDKDEKKQARYLQLLGAKERSGTQK